MRRIRPLNGIGGGVVMALLLAGGPAGAETAPAPVEQPAKTPAGPPAPSKAAPLPAPGAVPATTQAGPGIRSRPAGRVFGERRKAMLARIAAERAIVRLDRELAASRPAR